MKRLLAQLDSILLDRCAQPVIDRLARWADCFAIARALCYCACAAGLAFLVVLLQSHASLLIVVMDAAGTLLLFTLQTGEIRDEERRHRRHRAGGMNLLSLTQFPLRMLWLFNLALTPILADVPIFLLKSAEQSAIVSAGQSAIIATNALWLLAYYASACEAHPPPPRPAPRLAEWQALALGAT